MLSNVHFHLKFSDRSFCRFIFLISFCLNILFNFNSSYFVLFLWFLQALANLATERDGPCSVFCFTEQPLFSTIRQHVNSTVGINFEFSCLFILNDWKNEHWTKSSTLLHLSTASFYAGYSWSMWVRLESLSENQRNLFRLCYHLSIVWNTILSIFNRGLICDSFLADEDAMQVFIVGDQVLYLCFSSHFFT